MFKKIVFCSLITSTAMLCCYPGFAAGFKAEVVEVTDGDTIMVAHDGATQKIRLSGIDCPEIDQAFGVDATKFTAAECLHKTVTVVPSNQDGYGRTVADVLLPDSSNLSEALVGAGLAWWYKDFAPNDNNLASLEHSARSAHKGLWGQSDAVPPWQYRHESSKPLEGRLAQLSSGVNTSLLQGGVKSSAPLQGGVLDTEPRLLRGQADLVQPLARPDLRGKVNGDSTMMKIVQYKFSPASPVSAYVPATPLPPVSDHVPLRADAEFLPPRRTPTDEGAPQRNFSGGPPLSRLETDPAPHRISNSSDELPPGRMVVGIGAPPQRDLISMQAPPPRSIPVDAPPPNIMPPGSPYFPPILPVAKPELKHERRQDKTADRNGQPNDKNMHGRHTEIQLKSRPPKVPSAAEEELLWDAWYKRINDLACNALRTTMPAHGNPAGSDRIKITVWANHHILSAIVQESNSEFDKAVISAYQSLDNNPGLAFPAGTQRTVVEYETAHVKEIPAATAGFESQTIHNDIELLK